VAPVVSSPAASCASPLDRLGFEVSVGCTARSTWLISAADPTFFYVRRATGPPAIWAGRPRSGRVCEGKARLGSVRVQVGQEIKLTVTLEL
jgi:hypothetical protein